MRDKAEIKVCVVDYGMGNLRSVLNKVTQMCTDPVLSSNPADILAADKIILPGVGQFGQGMKNLEDSGIKAALQEKVIEQGTPILGICLGMQLFTHHSEEGGSEGLQWIEATSKKFDANVIDNPYFKVPHMGWNTLDVRTDHAIYKNLESEDELYFCHSYYVDCIDEDAIASTCSYGLEFCSSVNKDNIHGMQFHPEKSHGEGAKLMENFIRLGVKESV